MKQSRVAIVLDGSSSMNSIRDEAISAFNEQIDAIKEDSDELPTKVSLVTFGTKVNKPTVWNRRVSKLDRLDRETYSPSGMTALHDALGTTINKLNQLPEASDPDVNFLVVVISDGAENNSKDYNSSFLKRRIQELEGSERWEFSYIGANQDMLEVSRNLGFKRGSTLAFDATSVGTNAMSDTYSCATKSYRKKLKLGAKAVMDFGEKSDGIEIPDVVTEDAESKSA